ncbi:hypothetical protein B0H63DRAFT_546451 [Podospora didyma]|uniref:Heterokaryon incompatibility domain-containing protein n=1 Tax=Podospora didyma TaxID=330526 RepID=A0AAE0NHZ6_9PEZI|nr:hypothetical protein B0H63DRAFT_546451 [Podospora didyma]
MHAYKFFYGPSPPNIVENVSFAVIDQFELQVLRSKNSWALRDSILSSGWISPQAVSSSPGDGFYAGKLDQSSADFDVIKSWLTFCTLYHRKACSLVSDPHKAVLPIKLFDCQTRSIIIYTCGHAYAALSYVWGEASRTESDQCTVPISTLPRTIEDAITSDAEEKAAQIQQMDLIYGNASCTIIAAADADPSAGLPGISRPREPRSSTRTQTGHCYVSIPEDPLIRIKGSVWNSRGWTFQEALLSPRCLIFCHDQVYFQCGGMT